MPTKRVAGFLMGHLQICTSLQVGIETFLGSHPGFEVSRGATVGVPVGGWRLGILS